MTLEGKEIPVVYDKARQNIVTALLPDWMDRVIERFRPSQRPQAVERPKKIVKPPPAKVPKPPPKPKKKEVPRSANHLGTDLWDFGLLMEWENAKYDMKEKKRSEKI